MSEIYEPPFPDQETLLRLYPEYALGILDMLLEEAKEGQLEILDRSRADEAELKAKYRAKLKRAAGHVRQLTHVANTTAARINKVRQEAERARALTTIAETERDIAITENERLRAENERLEKENKSWCLVDLQGVFEAAETTRRQVLGSFAPPPNPAIVANPVRDPISFLPVRDFPSTHIRITATDSAYQEAFEAMNHPATGNDFSITF